MPDKNSRETGARGASGKTEGAHPLVPTNQSTKESGPRRLYAAAGATSSTSTKEAGARRMYASAGASSGKQR